MKARTSRAAALHRQAVATSLVAAAALETSAATRADEREQRVLAERLRVAAAALVPGWLGTPLSELPETYPVGGPAPPRFIRVGTARPLDDARFPAVVPLLGSGHLSIDVDGRDPRVAALLRTVLLRLLAAAPAGSLLVRVVDATATIGTPFHPLTDAGLLAPPATDQTGLLSVLAEAEQWVGPARRSSQRRVHHERNLLLLVAALPEATGTAELVRLGALAQRGPEAGLHLIVAGWPPPPPTAGATRPPLPRATTVALRDGYALLGDPPGTSFGNPLPYLPSTGLNSPIVVDGAPPAGLLDRVCRDLARQAGGGGTGPGLLDLLPGAGPSPDRPVTPGLAGLSTPVGYDGDTPVTVGFTDLTPHWLVAGRPGSGKTSFLAAVLLGLCARYGPRELDLHLVSLAEGGSFARFLPAGRDGDDGRLPQLRQLRDGSGPQQALDVLSSLDAERDRRETVLRDAGLRRLAELPEPERPARVVCLVDEFQRVPAVGPRFAAEALDLLERLGRAGRTLGIHLVLASRPALDLDPPDPRRDGLAGFFPVRVALPGGDHVLQPGNDSAAGMPLGGAVVNTAGGLGGPRGATRGHERRIRFPDPLADRAALLAFLGWIDRTHGTVPDPKRSPAGTVVGEGAGR